MTKITCPICSAQNDATSTSCDICDHPFVKASEVHVKACSPPTQTVSHAGDNSKRSEERSSLNQGTIQQNGAATSHIDELVATFNSIAKEEEKQPIQQTVSARAFQQHANVIEKSESIITHKATDKFYQQDLSSTTIASRSSEEAKSAVVSLSTTDAKRKNIEDPSSTSKKYVPSTAVDQKKIDALCRKICKSEPLSKIADFCSQHIHESWYNCPSSTGPTPLCYAVYHERVDLLSWLLTVGQADPNMPDAKDTLPLIYAINNNTSDETTRILLAHGADARIIEQTYTEVKAKGLIPLCITYWLDRNLATKPLSSETLERMKQAGVLGVRQSLYSVVGQRLAASLLERYITARRLLPKKQPMVFLLAGPSGHGKTVLAERIGHAIAGENGYVKIDCANISSKEHLFGPPYPLSGAKQGSVLNNLLCQRHKECPDEPCVVLLDEIDRMGEHVFSSLFQVFDLGEWRDARENDKKTFSIQNVIFMLTTNILDPYISKYFMENSDKLHWRTTDELDECMNMLREKLAVVDPHKFSKPFIGRIHNIIPFLPFTKEEAHVITDQLLRKAAVEMLLPINVQEKKHAGHICMHFTNESIHCLSHHYSPSTGARSIHTAIENTVVAGVLEKFLYQELPPRDPHKAAAQHAENMKSIDNGDRYFHQVRGATLKKYEANIRWDVWLDEVSDKKNVSSVKVFPEKPPSRPIRPNSPDVGLARYLNELQAKAQGSNSNTSSSNSTAGSATSGATQANSSEHETEEEELEDIPSDA